MSKNIVILCDGEFPRLPYPRLLLKNADFIICCDGAMRNFTRHSRRIFGEEKLPDVIIGDLDSLTKAWQKKYADRIVSDSDQETNDMTKAFNYAIEHFDDIVSITFLGATGKREDHTIGNMSLLMEYAGNPKASGIDLRMVSDYSTIFPITDSFDFSCGTGRRISILTPDNSLQICSTGLKYKTDNVIFDNWWKTTLNESCEDEVKLKFSHPSRAIIVID